MKTAIRRTRNLVAAVVLSCCLFSVASAQTISYNYDKTVDFKRYSSYQWVSILPEVSIDRLSEQQIKSAVDAHLGTKGLKMADMTKQPDLFIAYQVSMKEKTETTTYTTGGRPWWWGPGWTGTVNTSTSTVPIGTLTIDVYDAQHHELIWRGSATGAISQEKNPEKKQRAIEKAVAKLLKNFPPQVNK